MGCGWTDPIECVKAVPGLIEEGFNQVADTAFGKIMEIIAKALGQAAEDIMDALTAMWMGIDYKDTGPTQKIVNELDWVVGYIAVASLLIAAVRMAVDRKGQSMQAAFAGLWRVILVSAVAVTTVQALAKASDAYASYLFDQAALGEGAQAGVGVLVGGALVSMAAGSPGIVIIVAILVILATVVQIILMIIRIGVMVMLVGTLPLAAAASMSGWGAGWWKKHVGWLAAWLLYKPAAALIFFSAKTMTTAEGDVVQVLAGLAMLVLSIFALPALLKLVVPATAALGGTSGGTVALGVGQTMATGAVTIAGGAATGGASLAAGGGAAGASAAARGPHGSPSSGSGGSAGPRGGGGGLVGGGGASGAGQEKELKKAIAGQAAMGAASDVTNSLNDNDGARGWNE
jgi:hypothetical protein